MRFLAAFRPFFLLFAGVLALARGTKYFVNPGVTMLLIGISLGCLLGGLLSYGLTRTSVEKSAS